MCVCVCVKVVLDLLISFTHDCILCRLLMQTYIIVDVQILFVNLTIYPLLSKLRVHAIPNTVYCWTIIE